tara:strand:- start:4577 stop:4996 length:420 start_codon:yes stop_codon:yes gene_type:complete
MIFIGEMIFLSTCAITVEVIVNSVRKKLMKETDDWALKGTVSAWMIPIYMLGLTYGFDTIYIVMNNLSDHIIVRWLSYPFWIWSVEFVIGTLFNNKLWDYSELPFNIAGSVSLLHYPVWVVFGIMFEQIRYLYWSTVWI